MLGGKPIHVLLPVNVRLTSEKSSFTFFERFAWTFCKIQPEKKSAARNVKKF